MKLPAVFRKTQKQPSKKIKMSEQPPPYHVGDQQTRIPLTGIKASSTPKWKWTQSQCQEWIRVVFITNLHRTPEEATKEALKFEGWGPTMYSMEERSWVKLYGPLHGTGFYGAMKGNRERWGAVPFWTVSSCYCSEVSCFAVSL